MALESLRIPCLLILWLTINVTPSSSELSGHALQGASDSTNDDQSNDTFTDLGTFQKSLSIVNDLLSKFWTSALGGTSTAKNSSGFVPKYCPSYCACNTSLVTWVYGLETHGEYNADIDCHVTDGRFDLEHELPLLLGYTGTLSNVSVVSRGLRVTCTNGGSIEWDGNTISNDTSLNRFEVHGCNVVGNTTARFGGLGALQYLILDKVDNFNDRNFSFDGLSNLRNLTISGCQLAEEPTGLRTSYFPNLKKLNFANNSLGELTCGALRKMPRLADLLLPSNRFTTIALCWLKSNLITLDLSNNLVTDIGALAKFKGQVSSLNLAQNHILELPTSLATSISLLNMSHNDLTSLRKKTFAYQSTGNFFADFIKKQSRFFAIDFSHNKITYIEPGTFHGASTAMKFVDLSDNNLTRFEREHSPSGTMSGIKLDVRRNQLLYPPFYESGFKAPSQLIMFASGNPYVCSCDSVKRMQQLPQMTEYLFGPAGKVGDFDLDWADTLDVLEYTFPSYRLINKPLGTLAYDIDFFQCGAPRLVKNVLVRNLNVTDECDIVSKCPAHCNCTTFEKMDTTVVTCSNLTKLPDAAPDGNLELRLSYNNISKLESRPYLSRVSAIDLRHSNISTIDEDVFLNLKRVEMIDLRGNRLTSLPHSLKEKAPETMSSLLLDDNHWNCSCDNEWMKSWVAGSGNTTHGLKGVVCSSPKALRGLKFVDVVFDCSEEHTFAYTLEITIICSLCLLLLLAAMVVVSYREVIKVLVYTKFNVRLFDDITENEGALYDVFIAYSSKDGRWVRENLLPMLEERDRPFKVCIHEREFLPGIPVSDNVDRCISSSRRYLMVISSNFLDSEWCRYEFQSAHAATMRDTSKRLVVLMFDDVIKNMDKLEDDVQSYLKTNTYLPVKDKWFKQKLLYSMPNLKRGMFKKKDVDVTRV